MEMAMQRFSKALSGLIYGDQFLTNEGLERWRGALLASDASTSATSNFIAQSAIEASAHRIWTAALLSEMIYHVDTQEGLVEQLTRLRQRYPWFKPLRASLSDVSLRQAGGSIYAVVQFDSGLRVIVVRGTDLGKLEDVAATSNMTRGTCPFSGRGGLHRGYLDRALDIPAVMLAQGSDSSAPYPTHTVFCGHSLGGAVAEIAALQQVTHDPTNTTIITFGSPSIVDSRERWPNDLSADTTEMFLRFYFADDPVPTLLDAVRFRPFETLVEIDASTRKFKHSDYIIQAPANAMTKPNHDMKRYLEAILPSPAELGNLATTVPKEPPGPVLKLVPRLQCQRNLNAKLAIAASGGLEVTISGSGVAAAVVRAQLQYDDTEGSGNFMSSASYLPRRHWQTEFSVKFRYEGNAVSREGRSVELFICNGFDVSKLVISAWEGIVNVAFLGETGHGKTALLAALHDHARGRADATVSETALRWTISPPEDCKSFRAGVVQFYELPGLKPTDPNFTEHISSDLRDHPPLIVVFVLKVGQKTSEVIRQLAEIRQLDPTIKFILALTHCIHDDDGEEEQKRLSDLVKTFGLPPDTPLFLVNSKRYEKTIGGIRVSKEVSGIAELYGHLVGTASTRAPPAKTRTFGEAIRDFATWLAANVTKEDVVYASQTVATVVVGATIMWLKRFP